MRKTAPLALALCLFPACLCAGLSIGRPAAVRKQVSKLDAKVRAKTLSSAAVNRPPVFSSLTARDLSVAAKGYAYLAASAADPDGDPLHYVWTSTAGAISGTGASVAWLAPSTVGVYALDCVVSDSSYTLRRSLSVSVVQPGTAKWDYALDAQVLGLSRGTGPDGTVYLTDLDHTLYAISSGGSLKWRFSDDDLDNFNFAPVPAPDGTVYAVAASTKIYAIAADGSVKWGPSVLPAGVVNDSPVIGPNGELYVVNDQGSMFVLDGATGQMSSTFTALSGIPFRPAIGTDGTIYVVDGSGDLYAAGAASGLGTAKASLSGIDNAPVPASDGTLYWTAGKTLNALAASGGAKWGPVSFRSIYDDPVIGTDGYLYLYDDGGSSGLLYRIDPADGSGSAAPFSSLSAVSAQPAAGPSGSVYVADSGTDLHDLAAAGSDIWPAITSGNSIGGIMAAPDGSVFYTTDDSVVHAVYSSAAPLDP